MPMRTHAAIIGERKRERELTMQRDAHVYTITRVSKLLGRGANLRNGGTNGGTNGRLTRSRRACTSRVSRRHGEGGREGGRRRDGK